MNNNQTDAKDAMREVGWFHIAAEACEKLAEVYDHRMAQEPMWGLGKLKPEALKECAQAMRWQAAQLSKGNGDSLILADAQDKDGLLDPNMPAQELRLHAGELTADEVRLARAMIRWANTRQPAPLDEGLDAKLQNEINSWAPILPHDPVSLYGARLERLRSMAATHNQKKADK